MPDFNQTYFEGIRHKLALINWEAEFSGLGTFESCNLFKDMLSHKGICTLHIPYRQMRSRKSKTVLLTKDIPRAIQAKSTVKKKEEMHPLRQIQKVMEIKAGQGVRPSEALQSRQQDFFFQFL